jgi:hypothetical protein
MVGMEITCLSKENKKQGKMMGVKVKKEVWTDKSSGAERSEIRLIVTASAQVKVGPSDEIVDDDPQVDENGNPIVKPKPVVATKVTMTPVQVYSEALKMTSEILSGEANASVFKDLVAKGYSEETIRTIATGIAIELNRRQAK